MIRTERDFKTLGGSGMQTFYNRVAKQNGMGKVLGGGSTQELIGNAKKIENSLRENGLMGAPLEQLVPAPWLESMKLVATTEPADDSEPEDEGKRYTYTEPVGLTPSRKAKADDLIGELEGLGFEFQPAAKRSRPSSRQEAAGPADAADGAAGTSGQAAIEAPSSRSQGMHEPMPPPAATSQPIATSPAASSSLTEEEGRFAEREARAMYRSLGTEEPTNGDGSADEEACRSHARAGKPLSTVADAVTNAAAN